MAKFEIFDEKNSKEVLRFRLIKNEKYNFIHVALVDYNGEVLPDGYICTISKDGLNRCGGFNSDSIALDKGKITSRIKLEH